MDEKKNGREGQEDQGKGSDLVLSVYNKATKQTMVVDPANGDGEFIVSLAKPDRVGEMFTSTHCTAKFIVDHLLHVAEENKKEFMISILIAVTSGIIGKDVMKGIEIRKVDLTSPNSPFGMGGPGKPGDPFNDPSGGKPPISH